MKEAKRILLLMDAPGAPLYAPRIRYIISNLSKRGWQFTVISEKMPHTDFHFANCQHLLFPYYEEKDGRLNRLRWMADKLFNFKEHRFLRFIKKHIQPSEVDCILCSVFHTFPLPTAARLAAEWQLPLIADLRDIAEQWGETPYMQHPIRTPFTSVNKVLTHAYTRLSMLQRNKALETASSVITVSPWHQKVLQSIHPSVQLIYNGYDEHIFIPKDIPTDSFHIIYTGKIYDVQLRNPLLLFRALEAMRDQGRLPEKLQVDFYCEKGIQDELSVLAKHHHIADRVHINDFISNQQIVPLLHTSSICLILTNKAEKDGPHGIMTTKFFEALGVEKPVLCVPSDEECLADVIRQTNAGLAATSIEEVQAFILDKYAEWQDKGYTRQAVNQEQKRLFSRQYQAQQFEQIFLQLLN